MLAQEVLLQLQKYDFDLPARQEPSGRRRPRYIARAHIKDGKSATETALALRVTPRAVTRRLKWLVDEGLGRLAGAPHYWSPQRLPKMQEEAFRQAVGQLQERRGGGRVRGEDILGTQGHAAPCGASASAPMTWPSCRIGTMRVAASFCVKRLCVGEKIHRTEGDTLDSKLPADLFAVMGQGKLIQDDRCSGAGHHGSCGARRN
jgi:hypothetical protein